MQIEQKNYISNLPSELLDELFFKCGVDEKSRFNCAYLDKVIHEFVFGSLIFKLKLPVNPNLSSCSQIIEQYKLHCNFFFQKLPESFPDRNKYATVIDTKMYVDRVLQMPYDTEKGSISVLEEAWYCFSETLPIINFVRLSEKALEQEAIKNGVRIIVHVNHFPNEVRTKVKMVFNKIISANTNQEIQIFLAAGARSTRGRSHAHIISALIATDWCTLETIKMLVEYKYELSTTTFLAAVQLKRCEPILLDLLKALDDEHSLCLLCKDLPVESRYLIENDEYLGKISEVSSDTICLAMKKLYSEKFILKLLGKCRKIDDSILRFALKNYSENVILPMLIKCDELIFQDFIQMSAIRSKLSEIVLEKIVDKSSKVRSQTIELVEQQGIYSVSLLEKMRNKRS